MSAIRLNPLDASWLYTESRATPMHVGALLPFRLPAGAPKDFGRRLMAELRKHRRFAPPWNRRLKSSLLMMPVHYWVEDEDIDLEAHLRHASLPHPGGERELGELIARLHSQFSLALELVADADATEPVGVDLGRAPRCRHRCRRRWR